MTFERKLISVSKININELNPRFEPQDGQNSEMKLIIGDPKNQKKLLNLMEDIAKYGLDPTENIMVSYDAETKSYKSEEGNRRITAIKILNNPNVIPSSTSNHDLLFKKVEKIIRQYNYKAITNLNCSVVDNEYVRQHFIELKHTGENEGVGRISWNSESQARFSSTQTFREFIISFLKEFHKEVKDGFGITTVEQRIFGDPDMRTAIGFMLNKEKPSITFIDDDAKKKLYYIIDELVRKKINVKNLYTKDQRKKYIRENFINKDEWKKFNVSFNGLTYPAPETKSKAEESQENNADSLILELAQSKIRIKRYNDYNLTNLISLATDSEGNDLSKNIVFYMEESNYIKQNHFFSGDAPIGKYQIQVKLIKNNLNVSKGVTIEIYQPANSINAPRVANNFFKSAVSFVIGKINININETVNELINEIESLSDPKNYKLMITSSIRQLLELSIVEIIAKKHFQDQGNLTNNLKFILSYLLADNHRLTAIFKSDNQIRYQATKDFLKAIDSEKIISYFNLVTHDSGTAIFSELTEKVNKQVTPLLVVFHNLLMYQG